MRNIFPRNPAKKARDRWVSEFIRQLGNAEVKKGYELDREEIGRVAWKMRKVEVPRGY